MSLFTRARAIERAAEDAAQHVRDAIATHLPEIENDPVIRALEKLAEAELPPATLEAVRSAAAKFITELAGVFGVPHAAADPAAPAEPAPDPEPADPTGGEPDPGAGPEPEPAQ